MGHRDFTYGLRLTGFCLGSKLLNIGNTGKLLFEVRNAELKKIIYSVGSETVHRGKNRQTDMTT
jgi:hypothetical protein